MSRHPIENDGNGEPTLLDDYLLIRRTKTSDIIYNKSACCIGTVIQKPFFNELEKI
jgi:hypothetical protein